MQNHLINLHFNQKDLTFSSRRATTIIYTESKLNTSSSGVKKPFFASPPAVQPQDSIVLYPPSTTSKPLTKQQQFQQLQSTGVLGVVKRQNFFLKPLEDGLNLLQHLSGGLLASGLAVSVMHPVDTVKTLLQKGGQVQQIGSVVTGVSKKRGSGIVGVARDLFQQKGVSGFYAGIGANVAAQAPAGAIKLAAFELLSQIFIRKVPEAYRTVATFISGALAFVTCSVVWVPGEVLKQRMQAGLYPSVPQAVRSIYKHQGWKGFYVGYKATLARDIPYTMLLFGLYSELKRVFRVRTKRAPDTPLSTHEEISLAAIAGAVTGFFTTPIDVAKTKIMTQPTNVSAALSYTGILDALTKTVKADGPKALFTGATVRVAWLVPYTAIFFAVHEAAKRSMRNHQLHKKPVLTNAN